MGREIKGGVPLPVRDGDLLVWAIELVFRHMLVIGAPNMGKSETLIKLVYEVARLRSEGKRKIKIIFIDAKSDYGAARRMVGLWQMLDRQLTVVPVQHLNGFCGSGLAVAERLNSVIPHAKEGSASWWRDIGELVIRIVCLAEKGPPSSSIDLLKKIDYKALDPRGKRMAEQYGLEAKEFFQTRMRYANLWGNIQNRFDGALGLEDVEDVYVLCASLGKPTLTEKFSIFFFTDMMNFLTERKDEDEEVLVVVDELPALAKFISLEEPFEQLRGKKVGLIIAAQSMDGIGDIGTQRRYLAAADTKVVHGGLDSDLLIEAAGMRKVPNPTWRYGDGNKVEIMARFEDRDRITGDDIGELPVGHAIVIRRKRPSFVEMERAPLVDPEGNPLTNAELPPEEPLKEPMLELAAPPEAAPMGGFKESEDEGGSEMAEELLGDSEPRSSVPDEGEAVEAAGGDSSEEPEDVDEPDGGPSGEDAGHPRGDAGKVKKAKATKRRKAKAKKASKAKKAKKSSKSKEAKESKGATKGPPTTKAGWLNELVGKKTEATQDKEKEGDENE
jgi:hypothetical protein